MRAAQKENAPASVDATAQDKVRTPASAATTAKNKARESSSIEFPYADLDTAIAVARTIAQIGGDGCALEQLAGFWRVTPTSGNFRARYAPARVFGLIFIEKGDARLTPLGRRIVDRTQEAAARVDAFLSVILYKAIFEKYRGYQLPGKDALENDMVSMGVAGTQKDKARQTFTRSARQSGLFWTGEIQP